MARRMTSSAASPEVLASWGSGRGGDYLALDDELSSVRQLLFRLVCLHAVES